MKYNNISLSLAHIGLAREVQPLGTAELTRHMKLGLLLRKNGTLVYLAAS